MPLASMDILEMRGVRLQAPSRDKNGPHYCARSTASIFLCGQKCRAWIVKRYCVCGMSELNISCMTSVLTYRHQFLHSECVNEPVIMHIQHVLGLDTICKQQSLHGE